MWKHELSGLRDGEENFIEESENDTAHLKINSLDYGTRKRLNNSIKSIDRKIAPTGIAHRALSSDEDISSLYSIRNQLGYPIKIYSYSSGRKTEYSMENGQSKGIEDMKGYFDLTNNDPYSLISHFDLEILMPYKNYNARKASNTENILLKNLRMGGMTQMGFETLVFAEAGTKILKKIDVVGAKTVVNLCSTVSFVNRTRFEVALQIINKYQKEQITVQSYADEFLPLRFLDFSCRFSIKDFGNAVNSWSDPLEFNANAVRIKEPLTAEIRLNDSRILITQQRGLENPDLLTIVMQPAYTITNFLPFRVVVGLGELGSNYTYELFPKDIIEVYNFSRDTNLEACISLSEIGSSKNFMLYKEGAQEDRDIMIENRQGGTAYVSLKLGDGVGALKKIYVYSKVLILNNSPFKLNFHYIDGLFNSNLRTFLSGIAHDYNYEEHECTLGYVPAEDNRLLVSCMEGSYIISDDFKMDSIGVRVVSLKNRGLELKSLMKDSYKKTSPIPKQIDLGMQVTLQDNVKYEVEENEVLYTKYVVFTPRYVFVNNSPHILQVCQHTELSHIEKVKPMERKPICWPDSDKK